MGSFLSSFFCKVLPSKVNIVQVILAELHSMLTCDLNVKFASKTTPRFRAFSLALISLFPILTKRFGSFVHCFRVPITNSSVLSSLNLNLLISIQDWMSWTHPSICSIKRDIQQLARMTYRVMYHRGGTSCFFFDWCLPKVANIREKVRCPAPILVEHRKIVVPFLTYHP